MTKKLLFVLLLSGVIFSPMGAYAMDEEGGMPGSSISRTAPSAKIIEEGIDANGKLFTVVKEEKIDRQGRPYQLTTTKRIDSNGNPVTSSTSMYPSGEFYGVTETATIYGYVPLSEQSQKPGVFSPYVARPSTPPSSVPAWEELIRQKRLLPPGAEGQSQKQMTLIPDKTGQLR